MEFGCFFLEYLCIEASLMYRRRLGAAFARKDPKCGLESPVGWTGLDMLKPPSGISKVALNAPALQLEAV